MGVKIEREDIEDFKVTLVEPTHQEEPSIYDLKYLVYRLDLQKQFELNDMETKLLSFILSFFQTSDKFYFGNQSLAKLFDKHTNTISSAISSLEKKGLIVCSRKIMAGGGEIRFIQLTNKHEQGSQKIVSKAHRKLGENNNKINNNKYDISKDISDKSVPPKEKKKKENKRSYGNEDINECIGYLKEKVGGQLDGTEKENRWYCYNLLRKMKKVYPETSSVEQMKKLINIATEDKFHKRNATGFKYLFYNFVKISKSYENGKYIQNTREFEKSMQEKKEKEKKEYSQLRVEEEDGNLIKLSDLWEKYKSNTY